MLNIASTDYPIRITKKEQGFYLFNSKTFETISLDDISTSIFKIILKNKTCTLDEITAYAANENIPAEDVREFISFLQDNKFVAVIDD